jgi:hypothetical protein
LFFSVQKKERPARLLFLHVQGNKTPTREEKLFSFAAPLPPRETSTIDVMIGHSLGGRLAPHLIDNHVQQYDGDRRIFFSLIQAFFPREDFLMIHSCDMKHFLRTSPHTRCVMIWIHEAPLDDPNAGFVTLMP